MVAQVGEGRQRLEALAVRLRWKDSLLLVPALQPITASLHLGTTGKVKPYRYPILASWVCQAFGRKKFHASLHPGLHHP